jgi:hypothetical protein
LIIEVHPKMSFSFKVDIDNTPDRGLVCKLEYKDFFKMKILDLLNNAGTRDINLLTYINTGKGEKLGINAENILEARNPRKIDISRTEILSKRVLLEARIDNIGGREEDVDIGANLIYTRGNKEFNFGNVDRKVQNEFHFQTKIYEKYGNYVFRLEGFDLKKTEENWSMNSLIIKKTGAQINLELPNGLKFKTGNIRVETTDDDIYEGTVDDKINSLLEYSLTFGNLAPPLEKKFSFSSYLSTRIIQIDRDSWIRGKIKFDVNYGPNSVFQFELNDDFINITGKPYDFPWQNRRFTFIRFHDLVEDKTVVGKLDLDYIFSEFIFKRTNYTTPFVRTTKFRYGFGKSLKILKFALPLEFFGEKDYWMRDNFGVTISFRSWL